VYSFVYYIDITFELAKRYIYGTILVTDFEVSRALFLLLERAKVIAEPSGVAGLAAVLSNKLDLKGKKVCCVISGKNHVITL
jgi:threonine dehydratase